MAATPTKIRLHKILKKGLRRCVYRRWEATVSGKVISTLTIELERMYLGNTPYPIARSPIIVMSFPTEAGALAALRRRIAAKLAQGYTPSGLSRHTPRPRPGLVRLARR